MKNFKKNFHQFVKKIIKLIKLIHTGNFVTGGCGGGTIGRLGTWISSSTGFSTTFGTDFLSKGWKVFRIGISISCSNSRIT